MKRENYSRRFLRAILGFISSMASGVLLTWSYYREPLLEWFPTWTTSDLSLIFSIHNIFVAATMVVTGFLVKRISTRVLYLIAALCLAVGVGGFYFLPEAQPQTAYIIALLLYAVIAPIGVGMSCLLNYSIYAAWYPERAGMVSGIMIMGFNTFAIFTGALATALLPISGIRGTMLVTGILVGIMTAVAIPLGVYPGAKDKLPPKPVRPENKASRDYSTLEALKKPGFWIIFFYHSMIFAIGLVLADHGAGIAVFFGAAALFGLLSSPAKGVSCLCIGWIMDKLSTIGAMLVINILIVASALILVVGAQISSAALILVGLILCGLGVGGVSSIKTAAIRFMFGSKNYAQTYGVSNLNIGCSSILVYLASCLIEAMGGSYNGVFVVILGIGVLALICTWLLSRIFKKQALEDAAAI